MNGPERPQTMQTATPFTTSAALASSSECGSEKVRNALWSCEDWSVTPTSWQAKRSRYALWRSAWSSRPGSLCWCRRLDMRRLSSRASRRHRGPQNRWPR